MVTDRKLPSVSARLGRYELFGPGRFEDPLGGTPWIARDATLHRRVWLFPLTLSQLSETHKRALGRTTDITDPTVLSVLDVFSVAREDPAAPDLETFELPVPGTYVVIEHVDARPLEVWMEQAVVTAPTIRRVLRDVAKALLEAHRRGMVHGRLTADYVLVDQRGRAHVWLFEPERRVMAPDTVGNATPEVDTLDLIHLGRALLGRLGFAGRATVRDLVALFEDQSSGVLPLEELMDRLEPSNPSRSADRLRLPPEDRERDRASSSGQRLISSDQGPLGAPGYAPAPASSSVGAGAPPHPAGSGPGPRTATNGVSGPGPGPGPGPGAQGEAQVEAAALANLKAALFRKGGAPQPDSATKTREPERLKPRSGQIEVKELEAAAADPAEPRHRPPAQSPVFQGRYRLLDRLGRGGAGTVFLARDEEFDREVALKVIALPLDDPEADTELRRLEREARALARIRHPNVVRVFESGTYRDESAFGEQRNRGAYIVLEYVAGESLHDWSSRAHHWRRVLEVYIQIARGLAAAHQRGLVHRDFKPSNALLGADGVVRVVDFGLAAGDPADFSTSWATMPGLEETRSVWGDRLTGTGLVVGTPAYMAPERYKGGTADEKSDQFSFCVALFESLYGDWPFAGNNAKQLRAEIMRGRIHWRGDVNVPEPVRQILERGLNGDPAARFPSMESVCAALAHELSREVLRTQRRQRALAVLVGMLVASGAGLLLWFLLGASGS